MSEAPFIGTLTTALLLIALLVAAYLVAIFILGAGARRLGNAFAIRLLNQLTLPSMRRHLDRLCGAALGRSVMIPAGDPTVAARVEVATLASEAPRLSALPSTMPPPLGRVATTQSVPAHAEATVTDPPLLARQPPAEPTEPSRTRTHWTVEPGDHFWSIAERVVAARGNDPPTERETRRYWLELIEANRSKLPDPSNPDLLPVAIQLDVPPV